MEILRKLVHIKFLKALRIVSTIVQGRNEMEMGKTEFLKTPLKVNKLLYQRRASLLIQKTSWLTISSDMSLPQGRLQAIVLVSDTMVLHSVANLDCCYTFKEFGMFYIFSNSL